MTLDISHYRDTTHRSLLWHYTSVTTVTLHIGHYHDTTHRLGYSDIGVHSYCECATSGRRCQVMNVVGVVVSLLSGSAQRLVGAAKLIAYLKLHSSEFLSLFWGKYTKLTRCSLLLCGNKYTISAHLPMLDTQNQIQIHFCLNHLIMKIYISSNCAALIWHVVA